MKSYVLIFCFSFGFSFGFSAPLRAANKPNEPVISCEANGDTIDQSTNSKGFRGSGRHYSLTVKKVVTKDGDKFQLLILHHQTATAKGVRIDDPIDVNLIEKSETNPCRISFVAKDYPKDLNLNLVEAGTQSSYEGDLDVTVAAIPYKQNLKCNMTAELSNTFKCNKRSPPAAKTGNPSRVTK